MRDSAVMAGCLGAGEAVRAGGWTGVGTVGMGGEGSGEEEEGRGAG